MPLEVRSSASGTAETNSIHVAINTARVGPDLSFVCEYPVPSIEPTSGQNLLCWIAVKPYRQKLLTMLLSCHASTALQRDALPQ